MEKVYVLFNVNNNQYWSGRFWSDPYTASIEFAERFSSLEQIDKLLNSGETDVLELIEEAGFFEVKTIYVGGCRC